MHKKMVKMFITKSKIHENLKTTIELAGNTQENQAELSQRFKGVYI